MRRNHYVLLAAGGSALLLASALAFQYIGGLAPCKLCYWQRWPHGAAILLGALAFAVPGRLVPLTGALAALATAGVGLYHTGVERRWWEGPDTCTSGSVEGVSSGDLLNQIMAAPLVRCDEVAWSMMGLSMASWNAVASIVLALIWVQAMRKS